MIVKGIVNLNVYGATIGTSAAKIAQSYFLERIDQSVKCNLCLLVI